MGGEEGFLQRNLMSATVRTARLEGSTTVDGCLPFVAFLTLPPDLDARCGKYISRFQRFILLGMPFSGNFRVNRLERIILSELSMGAIRTTLSIGPIIDRGLPFVAFLTLPPDPLLGSLGHVLGSEILVFNSMPLPRDSRIENLEIVVLSRLFAAAVRTSGTVQGSAVYDSLPFMALRAFPPHFLS